MASSETTISNLPGATLPLAGTEVLPADQGPSTVKVAVSQILALVTLAGLGGTTLAAVEAAINQVYIGTALYPQTPAENALSVTPTNTWMPPYTILRYVASIANAIGGISDVTTALQTAINCAQQANYAMVTVGVPGAHLLVGSTWSIDLNKTGIDFQGALVDAASFSGTAWLAPTQSNTDTNLRPQLNISHPIKNATFWGPGAQVSGAQCVYLNDTSLNNIAGCVFRNIGMPDWDTAVYFGSGAFMEVFDSCFISTSSRSTGHNTHYSIISSNSANSGERNTFVNCVISNNAYGIQQ